LVVTSRAFVGFWRAEQPARIVGFVDELAGGIMGTGTTPLVGEAIAAAVVAAALVCGLALALPSRDEREPARTGLVALLLVVGALAATRKPCATEALLLGATSLGIAAHPRIVAALVAVPVAATPLLLGQDLGTLVLVVASEFVLAAVLVARLRPNRRG
jgi:hypothetical protein